MTGPEFTEDKADAAQICAHLQACDASFIPRLSDRVDLAGYAGKLAARARRFEAWEDGALVGLVAAYCNAPDRRQAFITSVSVLPQAQGRGIASRLVEHCIAATREAGFGRLSLEVGAENEGARGLYGKHGLRVISEDGDMAVMAIELDG
jgi:ribosomal protein S18 acetylase RimI-like enzyme